MDYTVYPAIPLIVLGLVFIVAIVIALKAQKRTQPLERYHSSGRQVYVPGEFSG